MISDTKTSGNAQCSPFNSVHAIRSTMYIYIHLQGPLIQTVIIQNYTNLISVRDYCHWFCDNE